MTFAITVINYTNHVLSPGAPVSALLNPESMRYLKEEDLQALREAMGLNTPVHVRYPIWLREALRGNLGWSTQMRLPVHHIIMRDIGNTLGLMGFALLFSTVEGIVLGIVSALKQYSMLDYILTGIAFGGIAVPGFFLGIICQSRQTPLQIAAIYLTQQPKSSLENRNYPVIITYTEL